MKLEGEAARYYQEHNQSSQSSQPLEPSIMITTKSFECPLHFCDTCYEHYHTRTFKGIDRGGDNELTPCTYCPRAFHTNCIPPGSRYNSICMVCPLHPYNPLPDKTSTISMHMNMSVNANANAITTSEHINNIRLLYDQLTIPEIIPNPLDPYDNHFKLYQIIKEEVETTPKNFLMISKNNYSKFPVEKLPPNIIPETGCDCIKECDHRCYNRLAHIECCEMATQKKNDENGSKKVCCLGNNHCQNRAFTNRQYAEGIVFREGNMGLGLKAGNYIEQGTLVIEYVGEIIDEDEMIFRLNYQREHNPSDKDYYVMELAPGMYVDGKHEGNVSRFINHSCNPNCVLERWNVKGKMRIGIFAKRNILPDESFSYDYQFDTQEDDVFLCYCGSTNCRGTMAPRKKERLLKSALSSTSKSELRMKLIEQGKMKKEKVVDELINEEWERSYTNKYLPGDIHHEIRLGPSKSTFQYGQDHKIFLKRNIVSSTSLLLARKERLAETINRRRLASSLLSSSSARRSSRSSRPSRSSETSSTTTTTTATTTITSGRKRKSTSVITEDSTTAATTITTDSSPMMTSESVLSTPMATSDDAVVPSSTMTDTALPTTAATPVTPAIVNKRGRKSNVVVTDKKEEEQMLLQSPPPLADTITSNPVLQEEELITTTPATTGKSEGRGGNKRQSSSKKQSKSVEEVSGNSGVKKMEVDEEDNNNERRKSGRATKPNRLFLD